MTWADPDDWTVEQIVSFAPRLAEMGAGTGYLAARLAQAGADIVAYDERPYQNQWVSGNFYPVRQGGPRKVARHSDRALLLCWPPPDDPMAADCLFWYAGDTLVYIGEGLGGQCADARFFEALGSAWGLIRTYELATRHDDRVAIYRRL